jgi:hypothetical protein
LHVLRARPDGGIRNKAAKGELRRGLRVGFVWGEEDGELRFHPDEAVGTAIRQVFARFAETGLARVWLWFRSERFKFPLQMGRGAYCLNIGGTRSTRLSPRPFSPPGNRPDLPPSSPRPSG